MGDPLYCRFLLEKCNISIAIAEKVPSNAYSDTFMKVCNECRVNSVMELLMVGQIQLDFGTKINILIVFCECKNGE